MNILELFDIDTLTLSETKIKDILPLDYALKGGDIVNIVDFQTCLDKGTVGLDDLPQHLQLRVVKNFKRYILAKGSNTLHPVNDNKDYLTLSVVNIRGNLVLQTTISVS